MTSAPGTKKNTAAMTHKLIEEVPLCPAAAIQRGPSTAAILNNSTSQKPIVLRKCGLESSALGAEFVMESPGSRKEFILHSEIIYSHECRELRLCHGAAYPSSTTAWTD